MVSRDQERAQSGKKNLKGPRAGVYEGGMSASAGYGKQPNRATRAKQQLIAPPPSLFSSTISSTTV